MNQVTAMILAGGKGTRLSILSEHRAKPAVPFGGIYRIIDFTLSNVMYAGIRNVGILTQYRPRSLMEHIGIGEPWEFTGRQRCAKILPPFKGRRASDWYRGTADAVYQNLSFIRHTNAHQVLVLSGDHVYAMDYGQLVSFHVAADAELTIAAMRVPLAEASRFGVLVTDRDDRVVRFVEKPSEPPSDLISLGIYVFDVNFLREALQRDAADAGSEHDFGRNVIPTAVAEGRRVFAYRFSGYWRDVGTVASYQEANFKLLEPDSLLNVSPVPVRTNMRYRRLWDQPPARFLAACRVADSLVGRGCVIAGTVHRSILSPGVRIHGRAVVSGSIILHDTEIGSGTRIGNAIIDKDVRIGPDCVIGEDPAEGTEGGGGDGITLIGKGCRIPRGVRIPAGSVIKAGDPRIGGDGKSRR
jgi:glucose-1-phosphate adenylyltransferase